MVASILEEVCWHSLQPRFVESCSQGCIAEAVSIGRVPALMLPTTGAWRHGACVMHVHYTLRLASEHVGDVLLHS
jgi:hypothetical protein